MVMATGYFETNGDNDIQSSESQIAVSFRRVHVRIHMQPIIPTENLAKSSFLNQLIENVHGARITIIFCFCSTPKNMKSSNKLCSTEPIYNALLRNCHSVIA